MAELGASPGASGPLSNSFLAPLYDEEPPSLLFLVLALILTPVLLNECLGLSLVSNRN